VKFARGRYITKRASWWGVCGASLVVSHAFAQSEAAVALQLDGTWPEQLAVEVRKDVGASLNERGVAVLADGDSTARATLRISPPSGGVPHVQVQVVNPNTDVAAVRDLSLAQEHPDTWSVAIAATADELLAATWSLPDVTPAAPRVVPPPEEQPLTPSPPFGSRRGEVGLGVALEQYVPNARLYGADLFGIIVLTERWQLELAAWFRDIAATDSPSGEIYGTVVGGDVVIGANVTRGRWFGLDLLTGVHAGVVWFDGRPDEGVLARSVTGALLSARLGGRASLFTTERTRVSLSATAGVPVVTASAGDAGTDTVELRGVELGARLEVGWQF
jgi:hypothetical protein